MSPERGWYHAEGDPPGTVRLWNGTEWVGFPQRDPNIAVQAEQVVLGPARGQVHLMPFAIFAIIGLIGPAIAYLFQGYVFFRWVGVVDDLSGRSFATTQQIESTMYLIEDELALQVSALFVLVLTALAAGVLFLPWFFVAYLNLHKWARCRHESWWAIVAWFVPFINFRRPSQIMQELAEMSPRKDREGAINPVVAWAWWLIFLTSGAGIRLLQAWALRSEDAVTVKMILWIAMGLSLANVVAAALAIYLIWQITTEQDMRFKVTTMASSTTALARV